MEKILCSCCGEWVEKAGVELSHALPDIVAKMPQNEKDSRCDIRTEMVVMNGNTFFLRGLLPLRISGSENEYCIGCWVQLPSESLEQIIDAWSSENQHELEPFLATLANNIPTHPPTIGLKVKIHLTGPETRPRFILYGNDSGLQKEQEDGVSAHRASEYTDFLINALKASALTKH